jgi:hypothetical protein
MLFCNWLHSVGQNHFFVMMLLNRDFAIQSASRRFCKVYKSKKSDSLQPSGRRDILSDAQLSKASSVRATRTSRPDLHLCPEASNCSCLHPFRRFSSTSGRHSVFDQLQDFFPKHRYRKIPATVWMMWIPFRTRSSIRQVVHSKFQTFGRQPSWFGCASHLYGNCVHLINCPDDHSLYWDAGSLDMEITCNEIATVRMTRQHRPDLAQIRKEFQRNFRKSIVQLSVQTLYDYRQTLI